MTKFAYKAKEGPSKILEGLIEADNLDSAISKIIRQGLTPIDITENTAVLSEGKKEKAAGRTFRLFKKVSLADVVLFTRQMSDLVDASVPIIRALTIVSNQTQSPHFKQIILQMYNVVKDGGSFSDALAQHPDVFSSIYINLVRTGEVGGQLERILMRLADYLEKEQETSSKVKSSLAYPALILLVGIATVFVLLTFVIPRISTMFDDLNQTLPLPTIVLIHVSGILADYWWMILGGLAAAGFYFRKFLHSEVGRRWSHQTLLKVPLLGNYIKMVEIGRFARSLGTLMESGVNITTALRSVWSVADNTVVQDAVKRIAEEVANGASLTLAIQKGSFFPEMAVNMISVGEETGRLERGLNKIADTYEQQSDRITKTIVSLLGPLVLVIIVAIVGFVVIAMLLPIFQMNMIVQ